jgi:Tfp pilus assembly protein PilO
MTSISSGDTAERAGLHLAVVILATAFVLAIGFQTYELIRERDNLVAARAAQEQQLQQAAKLRQQLDTLVGRTGQLANAGDVGARNVVDDLRRQGITFAPSATPPAKH